MRFFQVLIALFFFFLVGLNAQETILSEKEQQFLNSDPKIKCVSTNTWAPFNIHTEESNLAGISVDFWNIIVKKLGINAQGCSVVENFAEVLNLIKTKQADLTISTAITEEKLKYANFSEPYADFPIVIATRDDVGFISKTTELEGKKVAVGKGFTSASYLQKSYKNIEYVEVKNIDEGLLLLASEEVYAVVGVLPVIAYHINKNGYKNIKISGKTEFNFYISFMVRKDYPELASIISKGIQQISKEERNEIFNKWFTTGVQEDINYELIIELAIIIFLIVMFWIYREVTHKKYNERLSELLRKVEEKNQLLKELSITDKLTGLFNRVKIDETLKSNMDMYERYANYFSVILLDIDNFKNINDKFGHPIGDEVLKDFAKILQENIRTTDIVGRWGGEEFIIISPETDSAGACKLANILKEKINTHEFEKVGKVTSSFGVTQIDEGDSIKDLINRVDWALYSAKAEGKNRVICSL